MILTINKAVGTALAVLLIAGGCGDSSPAASSADRPLVIATTSIWGDLVGRIVGNSATVEVLIPRGADPHDFQLSSRQVARLQEAALVVANGLDLEEGLLDVLAVASDDGIDVVFMSDSIIPRTLADSNQPDPHFWTDPGLVSETLDDLVSALSAATDTPLATWAGAAEELDADLAELDAALASDAAAIPISRRLLVTTHDSLGYFAEAYGYEVVGVAVPGGSTLASPSAADLSDLIDAIRSTAAPAIFVDAGQFENLADSLASSTDVVVVPIAVAVLGDPGSGSESYVAMMLQLSETIRNTLG